MDDLMELLAEKIHLDKEHSETLAKTFIVLLDDSFSIPTVGYAIFLIIGNVYEMIKEQSPESAELFKEMMVDLSGKLGSDDLVKSGE